MIKYVTFTGLEFTSNEKYEQELQELVSKPISEYLEEDDGEDCVIRYLWEFHRDLMNHPFYYVDVLRRGDSFCLNLSIKRDLFEDDYLSIGLDLQRTIPDSISLKDLRSFIDQAQRDFEENTPSYVREVQKLLANHLRKSAKKK